MGKIILPPEYPYLFETHLHTNRGSSCASCDPVEAAKAYKQAGYSGIIVTEHNWGGNTAISRYLAWEDWVRKFIRSYQEAEAWGRKNGLTVLWGYEAGFNGTEFLIYGLTPDFLIKYPEIRYAGVEEQYRIVHEAGGIVVHAHPFREAYHIPEIRLYPDYVDAIEGFNCAHFNRLSKNDFGLYGYKEMYNRKAIEYANENDFPITAGSDTHSTNLRGGGMAFKTLPRDGRHFIARLLSREEYLLTDGINWYDPYGNPVAEVEVR
ncbi:MAG: PHP domain-containing protein [Lachnospiraceae bacterium]|nr:PHP domain-containing protein [Lachnospiraceae bacterium]